MCKSCEALSASQRLTSNRTDVLSFPDANEKLEAQGPFTAHLITNSKQFSQKKKTTRMKGFKKMHVLSAIHQYVAVNLWSEGGFRQRRSPSTTYFCPALDPPLRISGRNHYKNGSIRS